MKYVVIIKASKGAPSAYAVEQVEMVFHANSLSDAKDAARAFVAYSLPQMSVDSVYETT